MADLLEDKFCKNNRIIKYLSMIGDGKGYDGEEINTGPVLFINKSSLESEIAYVINAVDNMKSLVLEKHIDTRYSWK